VGRTNEVGLFKKRKEKIEGEAGSRVQNFK